MDGGRMVYGVGPKAGLRAVRHLSDHPEPGCSALPKLKWRVLQMIGLGAILTRKFLPAK
jgi:hypothetical protein